MSLAPEDLKVVELLEDLPEEELRWLAASCRDRPFGKGEVLYAAGAAAEEMFFLLEGVAELSRREGEREVASYALQAGETAGRLPFSRMKEHTVEITARAAGRLAELPHEKFSDLRRHAPRAEERFVHQMLDRTRDVTRSDVNREKLASLGTMAAGLAHELNNPASAACRTAQELAETLQAFDELSSRILRQLMFKDLSDEADPFEPIYRQMSSAEDALDALDESDREEELGAWLEEQGAADPWSAAPTLVAAGFTRAFLEDFSQKLQPEQVGNFLEWVPKDVEMRLLARELVESTRRIAELVSAMKSYSYMDQGVAKAEVDLHKGLDTTLRVLRHKLEGKKIEVERQYGEVPAIEAYGSELNQVWTNLIDNAVAAMEDGGTLTLVTASDERGGVVTVDVIDDGCGIPEEIQGKVFDPFFTTRAVGEGTGLGLDISHRIVTRHHQGTLQVDSEPGRTRFRVRLPVKESTGGSDKG